MGAVFGSVLAHGQTVVNAGPVSVSNIDGESNNVPLAPFGQKKSPDEAKCAKTPMMPKTFFAKRKFSAFQNMIIFSDRYGKEFGYVQSWFF